ncbi:MAG: hypothetical protein HPY81_02190 [Firmicutes bacterium]|nr:hypothetical protein [Bacillota bacterium]
MDNLPEAENRCVEPRIFGFRLALLIKEVLGLLQTYDYRAAWQLLSQHPGFFLDLARQLAEHAWLRINLCSSEAVLQRSRQNASDFNRGMNGGLIFPASYAII